ncbi:MAG: hypothetical protein KW802_01885 [Candidatus Doudnabacteria bacterium]|nr:hypothetical protein [Candidatus Doudnabacteria bacterium]
MRKLLILAGAVVFLAAACNQSNSTAQNPPAKTTAGAKVDAAASAFSKSVDGEDAIYMQSDTDVVNSDQAIINSYNGVSNASSY